VDAWTFIWLMLILKIPVVGLFLIVRWAVHQTPEGSAPEEDGGIGFRSPTGPRAPVHPRTHLPRPSRRGAHRGAPELLPPPRIRAVAAHMRLTPH